MKIKYYCLFEAEATVAVCQRTLHCCKLRQSYSLIFIVRESGIEGGCVYCHLVICLKFIIYILCLRTPRII